MCTCTCPCSIFTCQPSSILTCQPCSTFARLTIREGSIKRVNTVAEPNQFFENFERRYIDVLVFQETIELSLSLLSNLAHLRIWSSRVQRNKIKEIIKRILQGASYGVNKFMSILQGAPYGATRRRGYLLRLL